MKIERPRLLEIIKEEIDWARQTPVQEALQADTITRLENLLKDLEDEGSSLVGVLGTLIDQIKKDEGLQEQEEEEDPWKKLAGVIQEAAPPQIDPETGKYPPPPEIPDVPSIPENLQLNVIDFLETIAGLKLKGSDIISREASKLLARIEGGGA